MPHLFIDIVGDQKLLNLPGNVPKKPTNWVTWFKQDWDLDAGEGGPISMCVYVSILSE